MKKILLIDDDKEEYELLKAKYLEYSFDYASNIIQGIDAIVAKDYDIVLLDYSMPNLRGDYFLEKFERLDRKDTEIYFYTGADKIYFDGVISRLSSDELIDGVVYKDDPKLEEIV